MRCCLRFRVSGSFQHFRGTPMQSAQGVRSTTMGESRKRPEESLLSFGRFLLSPATGAGRQVDGSAALQFY